MANKRIYDLTEITGGTDSWASWSLPIDVDGNAEAKYITADELTGRVLNVLAYGVAGDGVTDDTAAIQAVLDAAGNDDVVFFPAGSYFISDTLVVSSTCQLRGVSMQETQIIVDADLDSGADVLQLDVAGDAYGMSIENLYLKPESGTPGQHGINIIVDDETQHQSRLLIRRCRIGPFGGYAINCSPADYSDRLFLSHFTESILNGGIYWNRSGDSVWITKNTILGANCGIEINAVTGALLTTIEDNNMTATGGAIIIHQGQQVKIHRNQIETGYAYTGSEDAMISIKGLAGGSDPLKLCSILDNSIQTRDGDSNAVVDYAIKLDYTERASIERNRLMTGAEAHIHLTANAKNTYIGHNYYDNTAFGSMAPDIEDNAEGTMGVWKTPTLLNSWVDYGGSLQTARYRKDRDGFVHLNGTIKDGTTAATTVIFALVDGFIPSTPVYVGTIYNGGVAMLYVDANGVRVLSLGGNTWLTLDGISFPAGYAS